MLLGIRTPAKATSNTSRKVSSFKNSDAIVIRLCNMKSHKMRGNRVSATYLGSICFMKPLVISMLVVLASYSLGHAGQLSNQANFDHSSVRLFQAELKNSAWHAGLEITLPGKWKTYWKVPGDAGIPPDFDWSKSANVASVDIAWPAPRRYYDQAGESIGYKHQVVFPLTVHPVDATKPVSLRLKLFYAVCDEICIPAQAEVGIDITKPQTNPDDMALLDQFSARVPVLDHPRVKIRSVRAEQSAESLALLVNISGVNMSDQTDVFVDGFDLAYFRKPKLAGGSDGKVTYRLIVDGLESLAQLQHKSIDVVVTSGDTALIRRVTIE